MPNKYLERRAVRNRMADYLTSNGWTGINFREGFLTDETIVVPCVGVYFLPSNFKSLQLGRGSSNNITRVVQIDCYMETEPRADAISEAIATWAEDDTLPILDQDGNELGMMDADTNTLSWNTIAPIMANPKIIRWRAIVRATFHAYYYE
jgi:hypothetical protein